MAEYKIIQVSAQPPREYEGQYGKTYYIKVKLEGHAKPVEIGKRKPDALKVGDTVYGEIKETKFESDGFKADSNPGGSKSWPPKDEAAIKAMWSIGQAVTLLKSDKVPSKQNIELWSEYLFGLVDQVKNSQVVPDKPEPLRTELDLDAEAQDIYQNIAGSEEINIDEIPF